MNKLSSIAYYVTDKISSNDISLSEYVTTDCILQNKKGREVASNLPPQPCCLTRYQRGDILIANIRPYLKKVWFADIDGGASSDVLVFRAKEGHSPSFLYAVLLQDSFFDYVMQGAKGSKMPRGDKEQILRYEMPILSCSEESIGTFFLNLDQKIRLNEQINQNLEAMAKQLYDYWFVQFDFPNENGKPYKSSGGKMVWNEKLKREIPKGWNVLKLGEHCSFNKRTSNGYFNHPILYLDTSNITNNTIDELQFLNPSSDIIPSRARRLVQEGDIVYSTVRPNLKHFGIIMNPDYNMVVSTGFAVITANWSAYRYFIYQFLIQAATIENLSTIAQSAVSAYPSINTSDIENLDLVVPPDSMIEKYAKTACRLYLQIDTNYKEIKSLTKQRDELLPLLMNGQVSVNSDLAETGFILFCISSATKVCFQLIKSIIVNSVLIIAFYINP